MTSITTSGRPGIGVASIVRAIRVLEVFADRPEGVALTRLSAELGYGKATLSKVLATMERGHFVRRDTATGHFHLSCRLLALAFAYAERVGIPGLCAPILQALADETGELVQLAVVAGGGRPGGGGAGYTRRRCRRVGGGVGADVPGACAQAAPDGAAAEACSGRAGGRLAARGHRARLRSRRTSAKGQRPSAGAPETRVSFEYHEPTSLAEAVALGARFGDDGRFLAGGTDLIIQMHRGKLRPRHVVSLHRVSGLDAIDANGAVRLGALVTHRALERFPAFQGRLRALVEGAEVVGGHQVRNVGTVGGNIVNASPAADVVPVLLTLDASVTCLGPGGERTLRLEDFLIGSGRTARRPDELLTGVRFAGLAPRSATAFLKAGRRRAMEISVRSEEHTSELQSQSNLVCRLLLEKKKKKRKQNKLYSN